jgi:Cro/C1-type HTH DNA-binding domain
MVLTSLDCIDYNSRARVGETVYSRKPIAARDLARERLIPYPLRRMKRPAHERSLAATKAALARDLSKAMARQGFTISSLSRRMGANRNKLSGVLREQRGSMNLRSLAKLAVALNARITIRLVRSRM